MEQGTSRREKRRRARKVRNRICLTVIAALSLGAVLYSGFHLLAYYADYRAEKALEKELVQLRNEAESQDSKASSEEAAKEPGANKTVEKRTKEQLRFFYNKMKEKNGDYVCWITVQGAGINYPVVKRDNSFYLNHDFEGEKNRHGSIFMDENCEPQGEVLLLHGHHMKDGTMFGGLKKYKENAFCEEHREIVLEFEEECARYQVFAVAQVDLLAENSFRFEIIPQSSEEKVLYIEGLDQSSFWFDESVLADGAEKSSFLILSTCDYGTEEERLLVAAKKIE